MLVPLALAILLTMIGFVLQFGGEAAKEKAVLLNQLSYYAYTWVCCIGIGSSVKNHKYLSVTLFASKYPPLIQKFWKIVNEILGLVVISVMFFGSFLVLRTVLLENATAKTVPGLPLAIAYLAPVVGYAIGFLRTIQRLVKGEK